MRACYRSEVESAWSFIGGRSGGRPDLGVTTMSSDWGRVFGSTRRRLAATLALIVLAISAAVIVPSVLAATQVQGTATIERDPSDTTGQTLIVKIKNTGTNDIYRTSLAFSGGGTVSVVSPTGDCSPGSMPGTVGCLVLDGLASGETLEIVVKTSPEYPAEGGAVITLEGKEGAEDNVITAPGPPASKETGGNKGGTGTGTTSTPTTPTTPVAPPAEPTPCKCAKLAGTLNHFHTFGVGNTRIEFDVSWEMTCTPGDGNCQGEILVLAPQGARFLEQSGKKFPPKDKPLIVHVKCPGPCDKKTKGKTTLSYLALINTKDKKGREHTEPIARFTPQGRAGKSFEIRVSVICSNPPGVVKKLKLDFDKHGEVDLKSSVLKF